MPGLTEKEARKKWCPHSRTMFRADDSKRVVAANRESDGGFFAASDGCLASSCMMWRWSLVENPDYKHPTWSMPPPDHRTNPAYIFSKTHGCCGLAGRD